MSIIYPWTAKKALTKTKDDRFVYDWVIERLIDGNFDSYWLKDGHTPEPRVLEVTDKILTQLTVRGSRSWVLLISQDVPLLQSLADVLPMTYAFTERTSARKVTTDSLLELFRARRPGDMFDPDSVEKYIRSVRRTGMLYWSAVDEPCFGSDKRTSNFHELLSFRVTHKLATIFTSSDADGNLGACKKRITSSVRSILGTSAGTMIDNYCAVVRLKLKPQQALSMEF